MKNKNVFMARKKQWGTSPTNKHWPKIFRPCHVVRLAKEKEKLELQESLIKLIKENGGQVGPLDPIVI